jgi:hypothetical protein
VDAVMDFCIGFEKLAAGNGFRSDFSCNWVGAAVELPVCA